MDVLADIVAGLALRSSLYFRAEFSAPFAVRVPADRQRVRFHVAGPGTSWIGVPSGESAVVAEGDLVLVPHGSEHVIADAQRDETCTLDDVLADTRPDENGVLRHGGGGASALLVCGHFEFDEAIVHPVIESLPRLIHIPARGGLGFGWMPALLECIERERWEHGPGGDAVSVRLSEILFIQVLRARLAAAPLDGALAALGDPHLDGVLEKVHSDPGADWSVEKLAAEAGLSRTLLTERFRARLGVSPMRYVSDWRMQRARRLLADESLSVGEVGRRVGYGSEAAFSRVFRQSAGEAPGRYRRTRREVAS